MAARDERMENLDIWILANLAASLKHENLCCLQAFLCLQDCCFLMIIYESDLTIKLVSWFFTECWKSGILIFTKQEEFYKNVCTP